MYICIKCGPKSGNDQWNEAGFRDKPWEWVRSIVVGSSWLPPVFTNKIHGIRPDPMYAECFLVSAAN